MIIAPAQTKMNPKKAARELKMNKYLGTTEEVTCVKGTRNAEKKEPSLQKTRMTRSSLHMEEGHG